MINERVLVGNMYHTILDKVNAIHPELKPPTVVTMYLTKDEKDNIGLILPESIFVYEGKAKEVKGSHCIS